jgi:hypothetical protein
VTVTAAGVSDILSSVALLVSVAVLVYVSLQGRAALKRRVLGLFFTDTQEEVEEEPELPLIVVAPTYQQACYFVNSVGIDPRDQRSWVYASDRTRLLGRRGNRCVFYGDWGSRRDAAELWEDAQISGFEIVEVESV